MHGHSKIYALKLLLVKSTPIFYAALFLLAALYGYLLNATVHDIVRVEDAEKGVAALNSDLGGLEQEYLALVRDSVTVDAAQKLGFISASEGARYITKADSPSRLTQRTSLSQ